MRCFALLLLLLTWMPGEDDRRQLMSTPAQVETSRSGPAWSPQATSYSSDGTPVPRQSNASAAGGLGIALLIIVVAIAFSLIPYFIARSRRSIYQIPILVICLLFGWTIIGWIAGFIWAFVSPVKPVQGKRLRGAPPTGSHRRR